jgi:hypothetical protein
VPTSAEPIIAPRIARRLVDRAHRLDHAEHRRDDAERRQARRQALQRCRRTLDLVVVRLDHVIHHVLDRVRIERARRDDDQPQRVGDQMDQRRDPSAAADIRRRSRGLGILDMRLERDRAFGPQHLHQLRDEEDVSR